MVVGIEVRCSVSDPFNDLINNPKFNAFFVWRAILEGGLRHVQYDEQQLQTSFFKKIIGIFKKCSCKRLEF